MLYKYRHLALIPLALFWLPLPVVAVLLLPTVNGLFYLGGIGVWLLSGALLAGATQYYQTTKPTQALSKKLLDRYTTQDKAELKALIKRGANPYAYPTDIVYKKDRKSYEPYGEWGGDIMSLAIQHNDKDMVAFLLDHGYDINHFIRYKGKSDTWHNHTPLMIAICHKKMAITDLLLRKGANRLAQTYEGETAIDMAADKSQSLGPTTAYDFPQKPPIRYGGWLYLVILSGIVLSCIILNFTLPLTETMAVITCTYTLPVFLALSIADTNYREENRRIAVRLKLDFRVNKRNSMPLIHVLHLFPKDDLKDFMSKAKDNADYPLVQALLAQGISPETYPTKDPIIQHLITHYPATVNALLGIKGTNLVSDDERVLLTHIALQKHAYEKTFSGWLKSFQAPTEPLLKDIRPLPLSSVPVEICLQQAHKGAIIEAGQSIIASLKRLGNPTTKQEEAIGALQRAASVLSQDEWKQLDKKILLAFHTDKNRNNTSKISENLGKILTLRKEVKEISAPDCDILETLITRIQPKQHDGEAASSGDFSSSTTPPLAEYKTGVSLNHSPAPHY